MIKYYLVAIVVSFLIAAIFGKRYITWLKCRGFTQPIKREVQQIYNNENNSSQGEK